MVIPHVFDSLLGIKPKNPCIASLLSQEVGSQDIGINVTSTVFESKDEPTQMTKAVIYNYILYYIQENYTL